MNTPYYLTMPIIDGIPQPQCLEKDKRCSFCGKIMNEESGWCDCKNYIEHTCNCQATKDWIEMMKTIITLNEQIYLIKGNFKRSHEFIKCPDEIEGLK